MNDVMWALVTSNGKIFKKHKRKYDLLKWGIDTKENISKKSVKKLKSGDKITAVFHNGYWKSDPTGARYWVDLEPIERTYTLGEIEIQITFK